MRLTHWLGVVVLLFAACVGCSASHTSEGATCDRYLELASVMRCVDGESWLGYRCPTDEQLAARDAGFATLAECVTFLESLCDPAAYADCDCITDTHCRCTIPLGPRRTACSPEPGP